MMLVMDAIYYEQTHYIASLIGAVAFAISGFLLGARRQLDIMGIFILAFLTANGGGLIRDVMVGRQPAILINTEPFWITALVIVGGLLLRLHQLPNLERRWAFVVCDGVGLAAFGITGALVGIEENVHFFGVLTLSLLTATGGGMIRDLLVNEVPEVLYGGFYGSIALLLGGTIYALNEYGWMNPATLLAAFCCALVMRIVAYRGEWRLPKA